MMRLVTGDCLGGEMRPATIAPMTDERTLRIEALLARIVANARMARSDDVLLNPDWVVIPTDIVQQIEELFGPPDPEPEWSQE